MMLLAGIMPAGMVAPPAPTAGNAAYGTSYGTTLSIDSAAFTSPLFWEQLEDALPALHTDPKLERFRGFAHNLRTEAPGETMTLANGQELLKQYIFPGLQDDHVERTPFPEHDDWTAALEALAPIAQAELADVLVQQPTMDDDAPPPAYADEDEDVPEQVWNRAAWFGEASMAKSAVLVAPQLTTRPPGASSPGSLAALRSRDEPPSRARPKGRLRCGREGPGRSRQMLRRPREPNPNPNPYPNQAGSFSRCATRSGTCRARSARCVTAGCRTRTASLASRGNGRTAVAPSTQTSVTTCSRR
jgi:hypothetical protein